MKYCFKIYLKHLAKNKLYTFITIFGFAVSIMFVLLLGVYINQELSVDRFHTKKDRIFRLYRSYENWSGFAPPVGDLIKNQFHEVENYCRIYYDKCIISGSSEQKYKMNYMLADSSFFSMFSFKLDYPGRTNVLAAKNSIVLSQSFARKIFEGSDPVGREITISGGPSFIVTAVMDDFPENTQFMRCDAVANFQVLTLWQGNIFSSFGNSSFGIYFLAKPGTNLPAKAPQIMSMFKKDYWLFRDGRVKDLKFEPLTDVYFSDSSGQGLRQNSKALIMVFMVIVLLVLIIAVINYINLTIAQEGLRGKETAIKKLMGSSKSKLIFQHITESIALSLFAAMVAIFLALLVEPYFNNLLNTNLQLVSQFNGRFVLMLLVVVPLLGMISGVVPALVINRVDPVEVMKGTFTRKVKSLYSKTLIGFQYSIAIILLICTWGIRKQTTFMRSYNVGFQKENIFWMENTINANQKSAFSNLLKTIPGVQNVSYSCGSPLDGGNVQCWNSNEKPVNFREFFVDSAFFRLMGLKISSTNAAYSQQGYYLNHAALSVLELPENTTTFKRRNQELPVLGIVNDFNFHSLYQKIGPLMIGQLDDTQKPWQVFVKLSGENLFETADKIKQVQAKFTGGIPMESGFIDDTINQWYKNEERTAAIVGVFTLLAIVISVMGIFAMSLFNIQQKIKEIGIRKINGAKVAEVMTMLNKDIIKWVAIAFVLACPVAWYAMHRWLVNFAYKTSVSWWIFALVGVITMGMTLLTVSWLSWKAARRNPVEALRYE